MDDVILKEIAEDIGEIKGTLCAMKEDITLGKKQFNKHDIRIKRVELFFVPVLAALSLAAHRFLDWAGW